ncbi:ABC transporter ATP-binding protein [Pollutimonas bauzanensis]|uniref:NitT/TauT family transport system ATP-binding protein n=1 Tax=Pollutimonas bauzanensis TaxID=658167 RepID=A0A1M5VC28_9BURK|nr:ABC transporter ATP-binding protein [Pollutimonas bauzanensis]SHH72751.1 NitT/TauT family transport system ATP-binding protein [Pollutimonas bauzanensis]
MRDSSAAAAERPRQDPLIVIEDLRISFGKNETEAPVLDDLSLHVGRGEFVALVGPSGCGKSTVLNAIAGLIDARAGGKLRVGGRPVDAILPGIGYMFQSHGLLPWRTVVRNIEIGLELKGMPRALRRGKALDLLRKVGLAGYENRYPAELSGGMRQRAGLARTLATDPEVLLMDEPFGALDAQTKLLVQDSFLEFWEQDRRTVLLVTHDLDEALCMADRILVMSGRPGRIVREYDVPFDRPRHIVALRASPQYGRLWRQIWNDLRPGSDSPRGAAK